MTMLAKFKKQVKKVLGSKSASLVKKSSKTSSKKTPIKAKTTNAKKPIKQTSKPTNSTKSANSKKSIKKILTKKTITKLTKSSAQKKIDKKIATVKKPIAKVKTRNLKTINNIKISKNAPLKKTNLKTIVVAKPAKPIKQTDINFVQQFQTPPVEKKIPKYTILPGADNERIKILIPILKDLVKRNQIHDWNINFAYVKSANIYMRGFECEDDLTSIREDLIVTIYERFPNDSMGDAKIPIITMDAGEMKQQILDAKTICASSKNPWYDLPEPKEGIELPKSYDENLLKELFETTPHTAKRFASQITSVMRNIPDVKLNACEIHTTAGTIRVINSKGIDISFHKTSILLEAVLTYRVDKTTEHEFQFNRIAVSPEQLDIQNIFQHSAQTTKDAAMAKPNQGFTGDIILGGRAVTDFFAPHHDVNPLVLHTSARIAYMGLSQFKLGESIGQVKNGEPITISMYPSLPLCLSTMPVDEDGTALSTVDLIRNGVFVEHIATSRYAQYLDKPVTGNLTNVYVHPGATREEHLRGNNYFEIVGFSWFHPDPFSGDFSAEIRLGYRWINGKKTAVRGGTFTGNIFQNILSARFSKETTQSGNYYGPRTILFKNGIVTKFE